MRRSNVNLYPYQEYGAQWLAENPRGMLWDQMRLGKTPQAITACDLVKASRVTVVCPAIARDVWRDNFLRWSRTHPTVNVYSYEQATREKDKTAFCGDVLILDEAHYLKTPTSKRTARIYGKGCQGINGIVHNYKHVWALTGSPCPNNVSELWPHLRALHPELLKAHNVSSFGAFLDRYCVYYDTPYGFKVTGSKRIDELRGLLSRVRLRRTMSDVFSEVPALLYSQEILHAPYKAGEGLEPVDEGEPASRCIATARRLAGELKAPLAAQSILEDLQDPAHKCVVFAYHTNVIEMLFDALSKVADVVIITGETGLLERRRAIQSFQTDPTTRVFLGQIDACHSAIDLSAADYVNIVEPSWVPEINTQASWRCMNLNKKRPVCSRFFSLADSIDDQIIKALLLKTKLISELHNAH